MPKVLYVATVVKKHIMQFHVPMLKMFKEESWQVDVAARNDYENPEECSIPYCDNYYDVPFERQPFCKGNIKAYKQLKQIINDGHYDIVHCHTPVGGVLTRLAARQARKNGTKVFYTAHGFHFYKGAPIKNWLLYYPVEKLCSRWTDTLITINKEDYELAKKKMKAGRTEYVPGVGIDIAKFRDAVVDRNAKRDEIGVSRDAFLMLSVGELNDNKNHETVIRLLPELPKDVHYAIAGTGELEQHLRSLIQTLNIADRVHLLGYRNDLPELYKTADLFVFPSKREGLSVALMEAIASGVPCIASNVRGNRELLDSGKLFPCNSMDAIQKMILLTKSKTKILSTCDVETELFDVSAIVDNMKEIYTAN